MTTDGENYFDVTTSTGLGTIFGGGKQTDTLYDQLRRMDPELANRFGPGCTDKDLEDEQRRLIGLNKQRGRFAWRYQTQIAHLECISALLESGSWNLRLKPREYHFGAGSRLKVHEIVAQLKDELGVRCLLSAHARKKVLTATDVKTEDNQIDPETGPMIIDLLDRAAKFDLRCLHHEDVEANAAFADELANAGLLHLPYPIVWSEFEIEPNVTIGVLGKEDDYTFILARLPDHGWVDWCAVLPKESDELKHLTAFATKVCRAALVLMSSRCARKHEVETPTALNKKREEVGKPPLYSHTVIEVRGVRVNKHGVEVGTHRSPRMHWRRGHLRHYRDPEGNVLRIIAIAPCLVGKDEAGIVEHEYRVRP